VKDEITILIVDDNLTNLYVLPKTLEEEDYKVMIANNGEDALEIASGFIPNLILLDVMMPGMDGFETCRKLKDDPVFENIRSALSA